MTKGIRGKWLCFAEANASCQKGHRGHGHYYTMPACEAFPCSCYGNPISSFFPDSVVVVWSKGGVEGVFIDEKEAEEFCKKFNIQKAEFFTSKLYPKKEINSIQPRFCDWKECNEIAIKRLTHGRMLCRKHAIEGGWIK